MGEARHTPGPWREKDDGTIVDSDGNGVVHQMLGRLVNGSHIDGRPEVAANRRLVAAAPELLASCKALVTALREYTDGHETPAQAAILSAAEAAITKAGDEVD